MSIPNISTDWYMNFHFHRRIPVGSYGTFIVSDVLRSNIVLVFFRLFDVFSTFEK